MPHIEVKCWPGRTEEQKSLLAQKIAEDVSEIFGSSMSSISVAIRDVPKEQWKQEVWDKDIAPNEALLYKQPGYRPE